jgi:hypothetical protein
MDVTAGVDCADHGGVGVEGGVALRPSSRLRIGLEAKAHQLGTPCPTGSMNVKLAVEGGGRRAALQTGIENCPLGNPASGQTEMLAAHFRLSLSCSLRCP